jgi:preprotein translocase subunit SecE
MSTQTNATSKKSAGLIKGVKSELKKVTWPNKKEMISYTSVVISMCLLAALGIGVVDTIFKWVLKFVM